MASSALFRALTCIVLAYCLVMAPYAEAAITCAAVSTAMAACVPYLRSKGGVVPGGCCSGVARLNGMAKTTPDRQTACQCLKQAAQAIPGINWNLAAGLPAQCHVNVPYKIGPSINCKTVK